MAFSSFLHAKRFLIIKAESTPGTAVTPTATDFDSRFEDAKYSPKIEFDGAKKLNVPDHGEYQDVPGAQAGEISASFRLCPGTALNVGPKCGKALLVSGLVGAAEGTTLGYSYSAKAAGDEQTYTAWMVDCSSDGTPVGIGHKLVGAIADVDIEASGVGKPLIGTLKVTGKYAVSTDLDNAALNTLGAMTSPDTSAAYVLQNATFKIGNTAYKISKFKMSSGNTVAPVINTADATGYDFFGITERKPRLSVNPLKSPVATYDAVATAMGGLGAVITIALTGPTYPLKLTVANGQLLNPAEEQREGRVGWSMTFKAMRNGYEGGLKVADMLVGCPWELLQGTKS
jgi:hypothetical protein